VELGPKTSIQWAKVRWKQHEVDGDMYCRYAWFALRRLGSVACKTEAAHSLTRLRSYSPDCSMSTSHYSHL